MNEKTAPAVKPEPTKEEKAAHARKNAARWRKERNDALKSLGLTKTKCGRWE